MVSTGCLYADASEAEKAELTVLAFENLPESDQARLFIDINAKQKSVKQNLLVELFAELHWNSENIDDRVFAIISKLILTLDSDQSSPFFNKIVRADDSASSARSISLKSFSNALGSAILFVAESKAGLIPGAFWQSDQIATLRRAGDVLNFWFRTIIAPVKDNWELGKAPGGSLGMNDPMVANVLLFRSIVEHLDHDGVKLWKLTTKELVAELTPWAVEVAELYGAFQPNDFALFRSLLDSVGRLRGTANCNCGCVRDALTVPVTRSAYCSSATTPSGISTATSRASAPASAAAATSATRRPCSPWLWFLTRTTDCRIFQDQTVPDIVKKVFEDHGIAKFEFKTFRTYRKWVYCVQYRESDYNFVARLLEHEGIYWYFEHGEGEHKLLLVDSQSAHDAAPACETLPYLEHGAPTARDIDCVSDWGFSREVRSGKVALTSYDFERPSTDLKVKAAKTRSYTMSDYEVFDFQGDYVQSGDGTQIADDRMDELQTPYQVLHGASNAQGIEVGRLLKLAKHPRADQNAQYLITALQISAHADAYESGDAGGEFRCDFSAIPAAQPFRPLRRTPKPFVQGPQTAVVVGPAGEEIFTDKYGRVKVQFHWDRQGKNDANSSCWVRVAQPWAGKNWGAIHIPRIGQEVDRRLPRRRPRPADHHRQRLQRRADAPLRPARQHDPERHQVAEQQGRRPRQLQRDPVRGQEGLRAGLHPRREEPGHRGRERRDALGRPRPQEDHRPRRDDARQARPHRDGRQQRDDHGPRQSDRDGRQERDDHHPQEPDRDGRHERDDHGSASTGRETVGANETIIDRRRTGRSPSARARRRRSRCSARTPSASTRRSRSARRRRWWSARCRASRSARIRRRASAPIRSTTIAASAERHGRRAARRHESAQTARVSVGGRADDERRQGADDVDRRRRPAERRARTW